MYIYTSNGGDSGGDGGGWTEINGSSVCTGKPTHLLFLSVFVFTRGDLYHVHGSIDGQGLYDMELLTV